MRRYGVTQFDSDTFVVVDRLQNREVCVCGNYEGATDARVRASIIAIALHEREKRGRQNHTLTCR